MREPNLDPTVEALVREVMGAVDDLRTARIRLENLDVSEILHEPTVVDDEFMSNLAAADAASPELRAYAERVRAGDCEWRDIERLARPVPPEVAGLKGSPHFVWRWDSAPPPPPAPRPRAGDDVVGPSDWPDDFDDYPTDKPWWAR
ncbi:hypothetical protein BJY24_006346 [Nocardia transvalensis]|uniref:Uncharacterized protein n=1 Tax=Nocardia transvalensis TaxID=37333 RepID=A0A7W9ULD5_9NOCA|nr:hypothetical protein [Nocardia transvalensis]MBB5917434.1 hypothetical protein [Nocardia transvalensis]